MMPEVTGSVTGLGFGLKPALLLLSFERAAVDEWPTANLCVFVIARILPFFPGTCREHIKIDGFRLNRPRAAEMIAEFTSLVISRIRLQVGGCACLVRSVLGCE